jgi:hypothetical protein
MVSPSPEQVAAAKIRFIEPMYVRLVQSLPQGQE